MAKWYIIRQKRPFWLCPGDKIITHLRGGAHMIAFYEHRDESLFIGEMTHFPFPVHIHEVAEMIALVSGTLRISLDGTEYTLSPGDIAVVFPLTPHSYDEVGEGSTGLVAIFPTDIIPEYTSTFRSLVPEKPVLRAGETGPDFRRVLV